MRRYETFVIMDSDLSQEQREQVIQRVEELISQMKGFLVLTDDWGERKLAYDIKKSTRGYYVRFDFCGLSPLVNEIERFFRIDDRALKYMTVLLDKAADLEKIQADKAAAEKAAAESKAEMEKAREEASPEAATEPAVNTAPVEEDMQADVATTSDESDSAVAATPLKNPEEI